MVSAYRKPLRFERVEPWRFWLWLIRTSCHDETQEASMCDRRFRDYWPVSNANLPKRDVGPDANNNHVVAAVF